MIDPILVILAPPALVFGYVAFDLRRQDRARRPRLEIVRVEPREVTIPAGAAVLTRDAA